MEDRNTLAKAWRTATRAFLALRFNDPPQDPECDPLAPTSPACDPPPAPEPNMSVPEDGEPVSSEPPPPEPPPPVVAPSGGGTDGTGETDACGLPPGVHLMTNDQLRMVVRCAATQEMLSLRERVETDVECRVGGNIRQRVDAGVRRVICGLLDERLGSLETTVHGDVDEIVGGYLHRFIQGTVFHRNLGLASYTVLGGLGHIATPWLADKVVGVLMENIAPVKIEGITATFYHQAPAAKHIHGSYFLTAAKALLTSPLVALNAAGGIIEEKAGAAKRQASKIEEQATKIFLKSPDIDYDVSGEVRVQTAKMKEKAGKWEHIGSKLKHAGGKFRLCGGSAEGH